VEKIPLKAFFLIGLFFLSLMIGGCGQEISSTTTPPTVLPLGPANLTLIGFSDSADGETTEFTYSPTLELVVALYSRGATTVNWNATQVSPREQVSQRGMSGYFREREKEIIGKNGRAKATLKIASSLSDQVGSMEEFNIFNFDSQTYYKTTAECKLLGEHCIIYLEVGADLSPSTLESLADTFDNSIYPTIHQFFGSEVNPGIDGDSRITLVFASMESNVYGYFDPYNEFDQSDYSVSNMREMLVLNSVITNLTDLKATMAHEFQHLVNFSEKWIRQSLNEEAWLNEGLSVLAEQKCGFALAVGDGFVFQMLNEFEKSPQTSSLTNFNYLNGEVAYAPPYLFMLYLSEQFGDAVIASLESSPYTGTSNVSNVTGVSFIDTFRAWVLANYLDGISSLPKYNYASIDLRGTYTVRGEDLTLPGVTQERVSSFPHSGIDSLAAYSCRYFRFPADLGVAERVISLPKSSVYEAKAILGVN
jgi:hypothetical protein